MLTKTIRADKCKILEKFGVLLRRNFAAIRPTVSVQHSGCRMMVFHFSGDALRISLRYIS